MKKKEFIIRQKKKNWSIADEGIKRRAMEFAFQHANDQLYQFLACVNIVLRDKNNFSKDELEQFNQRVWEQIQCIRSGYVKPEEMFGVLKEEIEFDFGAFMNDLAKGDKNV